MPEITPPVDGETGDAGTKSAADDKSKTPEPKPITFQSQEELDAIIAARVARAKPKDYDDLVALRDKVAAAEAKEKTDLEKAQEKANAAETKAQEAIARANGTLIRAAIMVESAAQNAADADTVAALLAGSDTITVDDSGEVKGAKQAVKKLLEEKPFLVKSAKSGASAGEFGGNDQVTIQERIKEAESKKDWATARRLKLGQTMIGVKS